MLRDAATLDDLGEATAPAPIEPGDLLATADRIVRVDVVLASQPGAACVPVLVRKEPASTLVGDE
jgi:hypothetical protein